MGVLGLVGLKAFPLSLPPSLGCDSPPLGPKHRCISGSKREEETRKGYHQKDKK